MGENTIPKYADSAAAFVRGGISASSYQPRHRDTRNRTDLALRPEATENNTALVARQEMHHRIALMSFLCRFPSWAYAWRRCRCCHLLASIIRVRWVASGMYVMSSTKKLKTVIGFKLNKRRKFVPRPNSTPCFYFMPLGNVANALYKLNTNDNT